VKKHVRAALVGSLVLLSACASIVKSEKIPVRFMGGLSDGETQLDLPDGQYKLKNGQTTVLVSRSKEDIPITVTCNQETRQGIIQTKYDALAGVFGNIIFGGIIGMTIDAYSNKAYDPPSSYNLNSLCAMPATPAAPVAENNAETAANVRTPSSDPAK
jgi:hypothetical protein